MSPRCNYIKLADVFYRLAADYRFRFRCLRFKSSLRLLWHPAAPFPHQLELYHLVWCLLVDKQDEVGSS